MSRLFATPHSVLLALSCCAASGCFDEEIAKKRTDAGAIKADAAVEDVPDAAAAPTGSTASEQGCATGKVDLLFVIDNSGSMAEEQAKLARVLPDLVAVLATGNRDGKRRAEGEPTDFAPATSMHIGVVSTDMGVALAPAPDSCSVSSFNPLAPDPSNQGAREAPPTNGERLDKPFGDDGLLQSSVAVAVAGVSARAPGEPFTTPVRVVVPPDPACAGVSLGKPYVEYRTGHPFEQQGREFSCIAKLGKNGCGLEQHLDAMLKAVTPADSSLTFSRETTGQGDPDGPNAGFLRDDAVLAIVHISDEDDCSIPDSSSELFNQRSTLFLEDINIRCGLEKYADLVHPVARYVDGLRALKGAQYRDRIIVTSIAGLPVSAVTGQITHSGAQLAGLLARSEMQFVPRNIPNTPVLQPTPACATIDGQAAPGRRLVQLTESFGEDGIAISICEDDYRPAIDLLSERISLHLGACEE